MHDRKEIFKWNMLCNKDCSFHEWIIILNSGIKMKCKFTVVDSFGLPYIAGPCP